MMSNLMTSVKRRKVLKKTGVSVAAANVFAGVGATEELKKNQFVGITYDPVTLAEFGVIDAKIARNAKTLRGKLHVNEQTLDIPENTIPLSLENPKSVNHLQNVTRLKNNAVSSEFDAFLEGKFTKDSRPLHLRISSQSDGYISGMIKRPGEARNTVAFVLGEKSTKQTTSDVRNQIRGQLDKRRVAKFQKE